MGFPERHRGRCGPAQAVERLSMEAKRHTTVEQTPAQRQGFPAVPATGAELNGYKSPLMDTARFHEASELILSAINKVIDGKADAAKLAPTVLLAQVHLLVEDVPGVGKTLLAKTLARTIHCSVSRIQFKTDLLPSDVTG